MLKAILSESKEYYLDVRKKIMKKLAALPKGSVKERKIAGKIYYYLQQRQGCKVVHKYLGKTRPELIIKQIKQRNTLKGELKKVNESLSTIRRSEGKRHD